MKIIYKEHPHNCYLLADKKDIKHLSILITSKYKFEPVREDKSLILAVSLSYNNDEIFIYNFQTLEDYNITRQNKYIEFISKALTHYFKKDITKLKRNYE